MKDIYEGFDAVVGDAGLADAPCGTFYRKHGKRAFDLTLAILLLPILAPVIAVLWILVRRDGGPGFFGQERVGKGGRIYTCWKIRTMVVDAEERLKAYIESDPNVAHEWHVNQKLKNDPRVTRFGEFVRKTSLDELPQIWNVLVGEMSFVGPRPFMVSQRAIYEAAGGEAYFWLPPGITGPWQVYGRSQTTFISRVRYDNDYLAGLGFWVDIGLIIGTVRVVCRPTGV